MEKVPVSVMFCFLRGKRDVCMLFDSFIFVMLMLATYYGKAKKNADSMFNFSE